MDKEIWKDIEGYEGRYQVSNFGRISKILPTREAFYGYRRVCLSGKNPNKRNDKMVHRLVAQAFIPNPENKPQVNHIDGNKSNNSVENLEWVTQSENMKHAYRIGLECKPKGELSYQAKLTNIEVQAIRSEYVSNDTHHSFNELAKKYGVSKKTIYRIIHNQIYKE